MKTFTQIALVALAVVLMPALAGASLQVGDSNYVGRVRDAQPSNPSDEVTYINALITLSAGAGVTDVGGRDYDRINSTLVASFPTAVEASAQLGAAGFNTINLVGTFTYILAKYDGPNWGDEIWYFPSGITGTVEVPAAVGGYGVSHMDAFNLTAVPEPGTIAVWGLLAVAGYFGVKKYQAKA